MNNVENRLRSLIQKSLLILENLQLADKVYFNSGKLDDYDKQFILGVTGGDQTTKLITDLYFQMKEGFQFDSEKKILFEIHNQIVNYNKNVFPIKDFDIYNRNQSLSVSIFKKRGSILKMFSELPSIAIRNLKSEIKKERDYKEFDQFEHLFSYFITHLSYLSNRDNDIRNNIYKKLFKSNTTLDDLIRFVEEKENLLGGVDFGKEKIKDIINENPYDLVIKYEKGNIMVVDVTSPEGIKLIGCNSLWCFTYGSGFDQAYRQWNNFSTNDHVYVIIDFSQKQNSPEFMYVLIKPLSKSYNEDNEDEIPLFDMANNQVYYTFISDIIKKFGGYKNWQKIFTFD